MNPETSLVARRALPLLLFGCAVLGAPQTAFANTSLQSLGFHLDAGTSSVSLGFAPFNPANGTLQSVLVSFSNVTLSQDWWLWNAGDAAGPVAYTAALTGASLTLSDASDSSGLPLGPLNYSGATPVLPAVQLPISLADAFHGSGAGAPVGADLPLISFNGGLNAAFDPAVAAGFDPGMWTVTADNFFTESQVAVDGTATVTYDFTPTVPDAGPGPVAAGVWLGLGLIARLARRRGHGPAEVSPAQ